MSEENINNGSVEVAETETPEGLACFITETQGSQNSFTMFNAPSLSIILL